MFCNDLMFNWTWCICSLLIIHIGVGAVTGGGVTELWRKWMAKEFKNRDSEQQERAGPCKNNSLMLTGPKYWVIDFMVQTENNNK